MSHYKRTKKTKTNKKDSKLDQQLFNLVSNVVNPNSYETLPYYHLHSNNGCTQNFCFLENMSIVIMSMTLFTKHTTDSHIAKLT